MQLAVEVILKKNNNNNTTKSARVWPLGKSHDFPFDDPLLYCLELP